MKLKPLEIGDLIAKIPIIQGGMGIGVSLSGLSGAVAASGGIGVISAAQIGYNEELFAKDAFKANLNAIARHIAIAREKAKGGIIGINIMVAMKNFEEYVRCSVENGIDLIISGAGLPVNLPGIVGQSKTKIAPIVSSVKAAAILLKMWDKRYGKTADMVVVEGPMAGGHLGFKTEELEAFTQNQNFDDEVTGIIDVVKTYEQKFNKNIPVVFAGGVFDRSDIDHYLEMGCQGVQMATRFVATEECDAHPAFKQAYIDAASRDIDIVKSPVGMPGRAVINSFIKRMRVQRDDIKKCYGCLMHCEPKVTPYCISKALMEAALGNTDEGLVFCGENAHRIKKMTTVQEIFDELTLECEI